VRTSPDLVVRKHTPHRLDHCIPKEDKPETSSAEHTMLLLTAPPQDVDLGALGIDILSNKNEPSLKITMKP